MLERKYRKYLEEINLEELRRIEKEDQKKIRIKQKEINQNIKMARKESLLPRETQERYARTYGKKDEKKAFTILIAIFIVCFILSFFAQPSLFFVGTPQGLVLTNLSEREISNVKVYRIEEYLTTITSQNDKYLLTISKLNPKQEIIVDYPKTQFFLAFGERQLPAIGILLKNPPEQQINTTLSQDSNTGIYSSLKDELNTGNTDAK